MAPLLVANDLSVEFGPSERPVRAVTSATFSIDPGEILGIAGESGSGKSTLCTALMRGLPKTARVRGTVTFDGKDLHALPAAEMRRLRGREISMVLQNPMTSIDPLFTVGSQVKEILQERGGMPSSHLDAAAIHALSRVHITAPATRVRQYPHQLSGGMKQRVLIAMATATSPKLLLADEPTTALDASIQEEILLLFKEIRDKAGTAVVIVTHDLGVIQRVCDRVLIMYAGRVVEDGPTADVFARPSHPYTKGLLGSTPRIEDGRIVLSSIPGSVPNLSEIGPECPFAERCANVVEDCRQQFPAERRAGDRHRLFCWNPGSAR